MSVPARHPSPIGRTAPRVGGRHPVKGEGASAASALDGAQAVDCRADRPMGSRVGKAHACPEPRALRERASRCLHGRDYGQAALLYALAEYHHQVTEGPSPLTTELAVLARHCESQAAGHPAARTQANEGRNDP